VFTLPHELCPLALYRPRVVYDLLFRVATETLSAFVPPAGQGRMTIVAEIARLPRLRLVNRRVEATTRHDRHRESIPTPERDLRPAPGDGMAPVCNEIESPRPVDLMPPPQVSIELRVRTECNRLPRSHDGRSHAEPPCTRSNPQGRSREPDGLVQRVLCTPRPRQAEPRRRLPQGRALHRTLFILTTPPPTGRNCPSPGGFHASDDCRHKYLSRWSIACPDGSRITPNTCTGRFDCEPGSCPDGQVCYHDDDPFDDRSFCVMADSCGPLDTDALGRWERDGVTAQEAVQAARAEKEARRAKWVAEHPGAAKTAAGVDRPLTLRATSPDSP
jgi:hypothetical protein